MAGFFKSIFGTQVATLCQIPGIQISDSIYREWPYGDIGVRAHLAVPSDKVRELQIPKFRSEIALGSSAFRLAKAIKSNVSVGDVLALISDPVGLGTVARCKSNSPPTAYLLESHAEQTPNPDSRVTLSVKKDPLNRPQPQLKWKLSPLDQEGVIRAQRLIAHEVGRSGFGRMRIEMGEGANDFLEDGRGERSSYGHNPHGRRSSARRN